MAVKRSILKSTVKKAKYNKALSSIRARLDALKPKQPGDGMIHLDPREWGGSGGFQGGGKQPMPEPPAQQFEDIYRKRAAMQHPHVNAMKGNLQSLFQQNQFQKPQPGPSNGMIQLDPREWGENGGFQDAFDGLKGTLNGAFPPPQPSEQFAGLIDKFAGGGLPQLPPRADPGRIMQQLQPTHGGGVGSIQLDPREWGGNGGFNQMPKLPNPPMKQQPAQMPGMKSPMPMPGQGGGMPPKQMPMPNPKRNLIPRPINPKYKMM